MHAPVVGRGPPLKAGMITGDGAEIVPDPLQHLIGLLDAAQARRRHIGQAVQLAFVGLEHFKVTLEETRPHNQNIAEPRRGAVLPLQRLEQPLELDGAGLEALKSPADHFFAGPFVHPPPEIDEHASAHDPAALHGALDAQDIRVRFALVACAGDVLDGGVVVEARGLLVAKVPQPVPLRGGLRVERPRVVVHDPRLLLVHVLLEHLPAEQRFARLEVERRVERDAHARFDLGRRRRRHGRRRLSVQEAEFVGGPVCAPRVETGRRVVFG